MTAEGDTKDEVSRRSLIARAATVTAGVAALGAAGVIEARPARASNGSPLILGSTSNTATGLTELDTDAPGDPGLYVYNSGAKQPDGSFPSIGIQAGGANHGVQAGGDTGVYASGDTIGVYGLGPTAVRADGSTTGLVATSVNGDGTDTTTSVAAKSAIYAHHEGDANNAGWGVFGSSQNGPGVHAEQYGTTSAAPALEAKTHGTGNGVTVASVLASNTAPCGLFQHSGSGPAVRGESTTGAGAAFKGGRCAINLVPKSGTGRPTSGKHYVGDLVVDSAGSLFLCTATGTPGSWVKVSVTSA